jgi:hypothetical protein
MGMKLFREARKLDDKYGRAFGLLFFFNEQLNESSISCVTVVFWVWGFSIGIELVKK